MAKRDVALVQPGGVSTVPPAIPVSFWPSTETKDAPPPTATWTGTPPGRLSRNWLTPPASRNGSVPDGRGRLTSSAAEPAVTAIPATLPPRRSTTVRSVPLARSRAHVTAELRTTRTTYPELPEPPEPLVPASDSTIRFDPESPGRPGAPSGVETRSRVPPSLPMLMSRNRVHEVTFSAARVRSPRDTVTACDGADVVRARAVPPAPATTATTAAIARTSRGPDRTRDIPRTIPPYGAAAGPGGHDRNRLDVAADHADQAVQHGPVADPQGIVLVLAGHPGSQAADGRGGLHRELAIHVHVVVVDRGGDRDLVRGQPGRVVQGRPVTAFGQDAGGLPERAQDRISVDHPGVDHLPGEVQRGGPRVELGELGPDPLGCPPGRAPLCVTRLVEQRVQRPAGEAELAHHRVQERVGELIPRERVLQQVVQRMAAVGLAEHGAGRLEGPHRQRRAVRQPYLAGVQVVGHAPGHVRVLRIPLVVRGVLRRHGAVGVPVDVVRGGGEPGQPAGDERFLDAMRRERQVGDRAKAAETLAEHAPRLVGQLAPDQLGVEHDAVGAEMGQVVGLGLRAHGREPG